MYLSSVLERSEIVHTEKKRAKAAQTMRAVFLPKLLPTLLGRFHAGCTCKKEEGGYRFRCCSPGGVNREGVLAGK